MFDHKHYVPIIKSKQGEIWALERVKTATRDGITPLVEVLPHKTNDITSHAAKLCEALKKAWGEQRPIFIDTLYLGTQTAAHAQALIRVFHAARSKNLQAIPVTGLGRSQQYQTGLRQVVATDKRGFLIRLNARDFVDVATLTAALGALVSLIRIDRSEIDILLDYAARSVAAEVVQFLRIHVPALPYLHQWRTLSAASGSFPASLQHCAINQWHQLTRQEWEAWITTLTGAPRLGRLPAYSDYGVRDPAAPPDYGTPSVNLRYTHDARYLVRRGALVKNNGAQQMPGMCRNLMTRAEYSGQQFSAGDAEIAATATNSNSTGNPQSWVQWCMSHHFEFVVRQIQTHPGI